MNGLIRVLNAEESLAEEERLAEERLAPARAITDSLAEEDEGFKLAIAGRMQRDWQANRDNRSKVDQTMLECLLARKGEYTTDERQLIEAGGGSDIYMPVTTGKVRTAIAHIKRIYLTAGAAAHGISPTPDPSVSEDLERLIYERILQNPTMLDGNGQPIDPMDQYDLMLSWVKREIQDEAKTAAKRHERVMNDQLLEGGFYPALSTFIEDFCTLPCGVMKGPYFAVTPRLSWQRGRRGMEPVRAAELIPRFRAISPFDAYPAPGVDHVGKGAFIERLRMTRAELYRMREQPGYSKEAVLAALNEAEQGHLTDWMWLDGRRDAIADHAYGWMKSTTDLDGLHWYSQARGTELIEWGIDPELIEDPLDFYEVDAIMIGSHVVRVTLNTDPQHRRPIHTASYEKIPGTVFGNTVPTMMKSSARMINATGRSLQNNLAFASGFQTEVNHARIAPETDIHEMNPFKTWQTDESEIATNGAPAVRFFQPDSNAAELMAVIEMFTRQTDTDTGIPELMSGGGDNGIDTARGQAMLMDNSAQLLRSAITNVDEHVIVPLLQMLYDHNMERHPDPSIKGDCQIEARGANAILQRESARQQHMAMLELTGQNPQDAAILGVRGRATLLRHVFGTFEDLPESLIPDGEEFDQLVASLEQASQQSPPDPQVIRAELQRQTDQERLVLEERKLEIEAAKSDPAQAERLKAMELASRERVEQAKLQKSVQDEVIKYRAERMAERSKAQIDVMVAKMQAEADARMKVAELRAQRQSASDQREHEARMAPPAPEAANEPSLSVEDIRTAVESAMMPVLEQLQTQNVVEIIRELTEKMSTEQAPPVFNISVDAGGEPVEKTITAQRADDGSISGTVTPRRLR